MVRKKGKIVIFINNNNNKNNNNNNNNNNNSKNYHPNILYQNDPHIIKHRFPKFEN